MSDPTSGRPRQVTLAAWVIIVGSVVLVGLVFEQISELHTIESQESVRRFLSEPPADELGIGTDTVTTILRITAMVAAGCATAAAILGYQVLRRSRSARLALTVLAVPLFLAGMVAGGFVSALVAASAVMLWLPPSRYWFRDAERASPAPAPAPSTPSTPVAAPARRVHAGPAGQRPRPVLWACVLTWVFSAVTAVAMAASAVAIALEPDLMFDELHRQNPELAEQGVSDAMIAAATYVTAGVVVLWCLAAIVLAVLVLRGTGWARIALVVSAAACAVLSLVGTLVGGFLLVFTVAAGATTAALLLRPDVRSWFDRSR